MTGARGHISQKQDLEQGQMRQLKNNTEGSEQKENSEGFGYRLGDSVGDNEKELFKDQLKVED